MTEIVGVLQRKHAYLIFIQVGCLSGHTLSKIKLRRFWFAFVDGLGPVFFRKVSREVHTVVENAADLDRAIGVTRSVQQEVAGMTYTTGGRLYTVSTMPKMVSPRRRGNLQAFLAAGALGIIGHIKDGANQECFIAKPS